MKQNNKDCNTEIMITIKMTRVNNNKNTGTKLIIKKIIIKGNKTIKMIVK